MNRYPRRQFLVTSSLAAATLLRPARRGFAAAAADAHAGAGAGAGADAAKVLVDWHSHYASSAEVRFFAARGQAPRIITGADGIAR